jgi:hypothetical protein
MCGVYCALYKNEGKRYSGISCKCQGLARPKLGVPILIEHTEKKTPGFSPPENYTDRATAAFRQSQYQL